MGRFPRSNAFVVALVMGVTCLGISVLAGSAIAVPPSKRQSPYHKLNVFSRVLAYIENNYVEDVDEDELVYGAIKGMVETLDPHTTFLKPDQYREMKGDTTGQFGGIGVEVDVRDGLLTVLSVMDGTPAARAGLQNGDQILQIDDQPTRGMNDYVQRMRGGKGTRVQLSLLRKGWKEPRTFTLFRDIIKIRAVEAFSLEPGYAVLRLKQFAENTDREMEAALQQLERESPGGRLRGLLLDLRNNPGGLLDQAVRVADAFIESGLIVRTEGRGGRLLDEEKAHARGTHSGFPIICLVNGGSASAAEIVAGALQDHGRALILGTQTFGKGSVQTVIELEDGSALKMTIARYYTPRGRSIQEKGITPDIVVDQVRMSEARPVATDEPVQKERDLHGHLRNRQPGEDPSGRLAPPGYLVIAQHSPGGEDHQLRTAYDYLKTWHIFSAQLVPARPSGDKMAAGPRRQPAMMPGTGKDKSPARPALEIKNDQAVIR